MVPSALINPAIIHFSGPIKPWHKECKNPYTYLYYKYLEHTPWRDYKPQRKYVTWSEKYKYYKKYYGRRMAEFFSIRSYSFIKIPHKARILFIRRTPKNKYSGIANYCRALYELFCSDKKIEPVKIQEHPAIKSRFFHFYYRLIPLIKEIKKADIIHVNGYTEMGAAEALVVAKLLHKKTVYTAHWHPFQYLTHPRGGRLFFQFFMKPAIKYFADTVVAINNEDAHFFSQFHKKVIQIPHWLHHDEKQQMKVQRDKRCILFVGRLNDPMKGIEHIWHLPEGKFDIHLVGNGDITLRKDMKQHCNISEEELSQLYAKASLLVVPSKYEAFSYATLEALMHGTPVVLSDRVRIADYLDGVSGVTIFPYGDYDAFCQSVHQAIGQTVPQEKIAEIFNMNEIKEKYRQVYLC